MDNNNLDLDGQTAPESTRGLFDFPDVSTLSLIVIHAVSITPFFRVLPLLSEEAIGLINVGRLNWVREVTMPNHLV